MKNSDWKKRINHSKLVPKKKTTHFNRKTNIKLNRTVKQIILAASSALLIGISFGFITLYMSKQAEQQPATILNEATVEDEKANGNTIELESVNAYVVQGGLFSARENADNAGKKFEPAQVPTFVWEREGEYYLLAGIFSNEQVAKKQSKKMNDEGIDVFVKQWETTSKSVSIGESDVSFLKAMIELWNESLQLIDSGENIQFAKWEEVLDKHTNLSESVQLFKEKTIDNVNHSNSKETSVKNERQFLLQTLFDFEQLTKE